MKLIVKRAEGPNGKTKKPSWTQPQAPGLVVAPAQPKESCLYMWRQKTSHYRHPIGSSFSNTMSVICSSYCWVLLCLLQLFPHCTHPAAGSGVLHFHTSWGHPGPLASLSLLGHSACMWKLGFLNEPGQGTGGKAQESAGITGGRAWRKHLVLGD